MHVLPAEMLFSHCVYQTGVFLHEFVTEIMAIIWWIVMYEFMLYGACKPINRISFEVYGKRVTYMPILISMSHAFHTREISSDKHSRR